jgi:hypothetical protein
MGMGWFDAAARGNVAELERHLNTKQKVDAKDKSGFSALVLATDNGRAKAVELLLKHKANPTAGGPAYFAIDAKRADILKLLLAHALNPNGGLPGMGSYVEKAIQVAAQGASGKGKKDLSARPAAACLLALADAGAKFATIKGTDGDSPLGYALAAQDAALLRYLIENGFDVDGVVDKAQRQTALMWCAWYDAHQLIPLLVELGANLEAKNRWGETPLQIAIERGRLKGRTFKSETLLRKLGADEKAAMTGLAKRAKIAAQDEAELVDETLDKQPIATRRGAPRAWSYDTWEAHAVRIDDLDALLARFRKSKKVTAVRDVTADVGKGKSPVPKNDCLILLKLKDHAWAPFFASWGNTLDEKIPRRVSRETNAPVVWVGHQDTASATFFSLYEAGDPKVEFQSTDLSYARETIFRSDRHKRDWLKQYEDENEAMQALVREQDAYVPMFYGLEPLDAFPEDTLKPKNVERAVMVVYATRSDD